MARMWALFALLVLWTPLTALASEADGFRAGRFSTGIDTPPSGAPWHADDGLFVRPSPAEAFQWAPTTPAPLGGAAEAVWVIGPWRHVRIVVDPPEAAPTLELRRIHGGRLPEAIRAALPPCPAGDRCAPTRALQLRLGSPAASADQLSEALTPALTPTADGLVGDLGPGGGLLLLRAPNAASVQVFTPGPADLGYGWEAVLAARLAWAEAWPRTGPLPRPPGALEPEWEALEITARAWQSADAPAEAVRALLTASVLRAAMLTEPLLSPRWRVVDPAPPRTPVDLSGDPGWVALAPDEVWELGPADGARIEVRARAFVGAAGPGELRLGDHRRPLEATPSADRDPTGAPLLWDNRPLTRVRTTTALAVGGPTRLVAGPTGALVQVRVATPVAPAGAWWTGARALDPWLSAALRLPADTPERRALRGWALLLADAPREAASLLAPAAAHLPSPLAAWALTWAGASLDDPDGPALLDRARLEAQTRSDPELIAWVEGEALRSAARRQDQARLRELAQGDRPPPAPSAVLEVGGAFGQVGDPTWRRDRAAPAMEAALAQRPLDRAGTLALARAWAEESRWATLPVAGASALTIFDAVTACDSAGRWGLRPLPPDGAGRLLVRPLPPPLDTARGPRTRLVFVGGAPGDVVELEIGAARWPVALSRAVEEVWFGVPPGTWPVRWAGRDGITLWAEAPPEGDGCGDERRLERWWPAATEGPGSWVGVPDGAVDGYVWVEVRGSPRPGELGRGRVEVEIGGQVRRLDWEGGGASARHDGPVGLPLSGGAALLLRVPAGVEGLRIRASTPGLYMRVRLKVPAFGEPAPPEVAVQLPDPAEALGAIAEASTALRDTPDAADGALHLRRARALIAADAWDLARADLGVALRLPLLPAERAEAAHLLASLQMHRDALGGVDAPRCLDAACALPAAALAPPTGVEAPHPGPDPGGALPSAPADVWAWARDGAARGAPLLAARAAAALASQSLDPGPLWVLAARLAADALEGGAPADPWAVVAWGWVERARQVGAADGGVVAARLGPWSRWQALTAVEGSASVERIDLDGLDLLAGRGPRERVLHALLASPWSPAEAVVLDRETSLVTSLDLPAPASPRVDVLCEYPPGPDPAPPPPCRLEVWVDELPVGVVEAPAGGQTAWTLPALRGRHQIELRPDPASSALVAARLRAGPAEGEALHREVEAPSGEPLPVVVRRRAFLADPAAPAFATVRGPGWIRVEGRLLLEPGASTAPRPVSLDLHLRPLSAGGDHPPVVTASALVSATPEAPLAGRRARFASPAASWETEIPEGLWVVEARAKTPTLISLAVRVPTSAPTPPAPAATGALLPAASAAPPASALLPLPSPGGCCTVAAFTFAQTPTADPEATPRAQTLLGVGAEGWRHPPDTSSPRWTHVTASAARVPGGPPLGQLAAEGVGLLADRRLRLEMEGAFAWQGDSDTQGRRFDGGVRLATLVGAGPGVWILPGVDLGLRWVDQRGPADPLDPRVSDGYAALHPRALGLHTEALWRPATTLRFAARLGVTTNPTFLSLDRVDARAAGAWLWGPVEVQAAVNHSLRLPDVDRAALLAYTWLSPRILLWRPLTAGLRLEAAASSRLFLTSPDGARTPEVSVTISLVSHRGRGLQDQPSAWVAFPAPLTGQPVGRAAVAAGSPEGP